MKREDINKLKKEAEESPIWSLEMRISKQDYKLLNLIGQGIIACKDSKWKKVTAKRNIFRKVLLQKLKKWNKNINGKDSNPTYEDYLSSLNWGKDKDIKSSEEGK